MKTAKITIYQMYGTTAYACDIYYRGMKLHTIQNANQYECSKAAFYLSKNNGFTHARLQGVEKPYTIDLENL